MPEAIGVVVVPVSCKSPGRPRGKRPPISKLPLARTIQAMIDALAAEAGPLPVAMQDMLARFVEKAKARDAGR